MAKILTYARRTLYTIAALLILAFALGNRQDVTVSLVLFEATVPLYLLILILVTLGVLAGGLHSSAALFRAKSAARRKEHDVNLLRAEVLSHQTENRARESAVSTSEKHLTLIS